jgi:C4-dicarboxylate transporter DctQ subunit
VLINRLGDNNRRKAIVFGLLAGATFTGIVATLGAHFVWENGAHYAIFKFFGIDTGDNYEGPTTPDLEWPTWIVYSAIPLGSSLMSFRFLQVTWSFLKTGELPHHDHGHVDGLEDEIPPVDFDPYGMDDNLHMHDLKHSMLGERRKGEERRTEDARAGEERRAAERRNKEGDQQ